MFNFSRLTKKKKKGPYLKINNLKKRISAKTKKMFFFWVFLENVKKCFSIKMLYEK